MMFKIISHTCRAMFSPNNYSVVPGGETEANAIAERAHLLTQDMDEEGQPHEVISLSGLEESNLISMDDPVEGDPVEPEEIVSRQSEQLRTLHHRTGDKLSSIADKLDIAREVISFSVLIPLGRGLYVATRPNADPDPHTVLPYIWMANGLSAFSLLLIVFSKSLNGWATRLKNELPEAQPLLTV